MANDDQIEFKLVANPGPLWAEYRKVKQQLSQQKIKVHLDVNKSAFNAALKGLAGRSIGVSLRVDKSAFRASMASLQSSVGRGPTVAIRADGAQARRELDNLRRIIANLRHEAATLRVRFDGSGANAALRSIQTQLNAIVAQSNRARAAMQGMRPPAAGHVGGGEGYFANFGAAGAGAFTANMLGGGRFATLGAGAGAGLGMMGGPVGAAIGGVAGAGAGGVADFGVGTTMQGIGSLSELQRYEAILNAVIPDQEKANKLLTDLKSLNLKLPTVEMGILADAATKLAGAGLDTATLPEDITAILDAAATSSDGVAVGTERVVRAIAQMKTNGKLLGEELNQLTETGIPAAQILVRQFGMSINDIKKKSQDGEIAIDDIIRGLIDGFRKERGGALSAQASTLPGQIAKLNKQFDELAKKAAAPILQPLIDSLDRLSSALDAGTMNEIADAMQRVNEAGVGVIETLGNLLDRFGSQKKLEGFSQTLDAGIRSGNMTQEQSQQASAFLMTSKALANRRREGGQDATLTQQDVADFFTVRDGIRYDPNQVTDEQRSGLASLIDRMAKRDDEITQKGGYGVLGNSTEQRADAARGFVDNFTQFMEVNRLRNAGGDAAAMLAEKAARAASEATGRGIATLAGSAATGATSTAESVIRIAGRIPGMASSAFENRFGSSPSGFFDSAMNASAGLRADDARREQERLRSESDNRRFDKAAADLPDAFKKFTADITDPEVRKMLEGASFQVDQVANANGGFDPRIQLKELQEMTQKRAVQTTDLAGLNSLIQSNIDEAVQREQQKKMLEAQQKIAEFAKTQNDHLATIAQNTKGGKESIVSPN